MFFALNIYEKGRVVPQLLVKPQDPPIVLADPIHQPLIAPQFTNT